MHHFACVQRNKIWATRNHFTGKFYHTCGNFLFVRVLMLAWDMLSAVLMKTCPDLVQIYVLADELVMKFSEGLSVPQLLWAPLASPRQYCVCCWPGQQSSPTSVILGNRVACPVLSAVMLAVSRKGGNLLELIAGPRSQGRKKSYEAERQGQEFGEPW